MMNTFRKAMALVLITGLTACAATPKPELQVMQYQSAARSIFVVHSCTATGKLSPELGALGDSYLKGTINQYSYDVSRLAAAAKETSNTPVTTEECNVLAMSIQKQRQQIDIQNQNNQLALDQVNTLNNQRSKQTYCNKIGTQMFCNTY